MFRWKNKPSGRKEATMQNITGNTVGSSEHISTQEWHRSGIYLTRTPALIHAEHC